jgi:hypothetical protein
MGRRCGSCGKEERDIQNRWGDLRKKLLGKSRRGWKNILKWILKKWVGKA